VPCDLTAEGAPQQQVHEFRPQIVIHLAAERRPDVVQKDPSRAKRLNVTVPRDLATACSSVGAWLLHFSTDYVFDGIKPPYREEDRPNPLNSYGEQKREAEEVVRECAPDHAAILRVPLLFGPMEFYKESTVTALYEDLIDGKLSKADDLQRRYPTFTEDVAQVVLRMVKLHLSGQEKVTGLFHWQSNECLTKYNMVEEIARVKGLDIFGVKQDKVLPAAPRPEDSRLDCSRLESLFGGEEAVKCLRTPFRTALEKSFAAFDAFDANDKKCIDEAPVAPGTLQ